MHAPAQPPTPGPGQDDAPFVAVVAVHGIGDQEARSSARSITDLLLRLRYRGGGARYASFMTESVRIPAEPARVNPGVQPRTAEHRLMRRQLAEYESRCEPFETERHVGRRLADAPAGGGPAVCTARVHVYEMYWADLSRLAPGAFRVFGELYQLLFRLPQLGRLAVAQAEVPAADQRLWTAFERTYVPAVWLLSRAVPAVWLTMLATALGIVVLGLSPAAQPRVAGWGLGLAAAVAAWAWAYLRAPRGSAWAWAGWAALGAAAGWGAGLAAYAGVARLPEAVAPPVLLGAWFALALWGIRRALGCYEDVRPAPRRALMAVPTAGLLAAWVYGSFLGAVWPRAIDRVTHVFEAQALAAVAVWYVIYPLGLVAGAAALGLRWRLPPGAARSTVWTACATLALSSASVLLLTYVLWAALERSLGGAIVHQTTFPLFFGTGEVTYHRLFHVMLAASGGWGFVVLFAALAVVALVALLAFLPAAVQELTKPSSGRDFTRRGTAVAPSGRVEDVVRAWDEAHAEQRLRAGLGAQDEASYRLGSWLSRGYATVGGAVALLYGAVFLQWLVTAAHKVAAGSPLAGLPDWAMSALFYGGSALAAGAIGLIALRGRFQKFALGLRPVLDAALDIDNYLREHPRRAAPRAKIAERYVSLLRYLCRWQDPATGQPYRSIVFVSHSQGTVITADVLGFLGCEEDPELAAVHGPAAARPDRADRRFYLFTMGSPLRQLYAQCFPRLFEWVTAEGRSWGGRPVPAARPSRANTTPFWDDGHVTLAGSLSATAPPDPYQLGVVRWVNAYRSGDYVGRALWRAADDPALYRQALDDTARAALRRRMRAHGNIPLDPPVVVVSEDPNGARRELCLGRGAHTHYWDGTARAVAAELDALIDDGSAVRVPDDFPWPSVRRVSALEP